MGLLEFIEDVLFRLSYLGVFWFSFISNSIPYMTLPYLFFIILYVNQVKADLASRVIIVAFSALGASLGKVVVYIIGYGIRRLIPEQRILRTAQLFKAFKKSVFVATLLFALLPLPDDILYIPLGIMRYDIKRFFLALFIGKFALTFITIHLGTQAYWLLEETAGLPTWLSITAMVFLTIYATYLISRIDWLRIVQLASERKTLLAIAWFFREVFVKTLEIPLRAAAIIRRINPKHKVTNR